MDVLDGIAAAKGFTVDADLKNVTVIMKDTKYSNVVRLNMSRYIKTGQPARMMLHPEDTIVVPAKGGFFRAMSNLNTIVPILGTMATMIILIRDIRRNP